MSKPEKTPQPSTQIDDSTLRQFVGYHLKRAFNVIQADLTHTLEPFELRMLTYTALVLIVDNPGLSQSQLAAGMDIERSNLVVIVDELERRDLIVRDRVPTDRRTYALNVTLAGRRLYEKAIAAVKAHEARLLASVDDKTRDALKAALSTIRETPNT